MCYYPERQEVSPEAIKECKKAKSRKCLIPDTALTLRQSKSADCRGSHEADFQRDQQKWGLSHERTIFRRNQVGFDTYNSRHGLLCGVS